MNSRSISTASRMTFKTVSSDGLRSRYENNKHAKSQCKASSRLMRSLEKVRPGIRPRFFNQNIAAKEPEKKIPLTTAKATSLVAKEARRSFIHFTAQSAFFLITGIVSTALNHFFFSRILDESIYEKAVHFQVNVFHHQLKSVKESRCKDLDVSTKSSQNESAPYTSRDMG